MKNSTFKIWSLVLLSAVFSVTALHRGSFAQESDPDGYSDPSPAATEESPYAQEAPSATQDMSQRSAANDLKIAINEFFSNNPALGEGKCGAYIKVLDSERVLYSYHGRDALVPASNMKVVTTATALDMFGPDFKFSTELWGAPVNDKGIIEGDLYLRGNGDPTNTPPYWETATAMYERLADTLIQSGVREINGDIVGDDSIFDRQYYPEGWSDHYHLDGYSAPASGLSLNGNLVEVRIDGSSATTYPSNNHFKIAYDASGAIDTAIERERGSNIIKVRGPLSAVTREITVDTPPLFAASAFANVLASKGIRIHGNVRLIRQLGEPAAVTTKYRYASIESPTLKEIITEINQQSDNFLAEHVFRTVGAHYAGQGNAITGEAGVKRFLGSHDIDTAGLKMADGCGLSQVDRITPNQLVDTLVAMANSKYADIYRDSLASNEHGTLRYRIPGADVHAKTGTLDHFTSLSGYVTTARGQTVVFSMLFNELQDISVGIDIQNRVVTMLAQCNELL